MLRWKCIAYKGQWMSPCINTAPIPIPQAFVSKMNYSENFGKAKTGGVTIATFRAWNALVAFLDHLNWFFLSRTVKGL